MKLGRNDPCSCGSGKKFKKCCERKLIGKKFRATKISDTSLFSRVTDISSRFTSLIKHRDDAISSPLENEKLIAPQEPVEEKKPPEQPQKESPEPTDSSHEQSPSPSE